MTLRALTFLAAVALAPVAAAGAVVHYAAPAGSLPAGHLRGAAFNAVLPSGRLVTPSGQSVVTGMGALGVALTPDGRFAVVSNDEQRQSAVRSALDPATFGGPSLAVVDTATMQVVDRARASGLTFDAGLAAIRDPQNPARTLVFAAGGPSNAVAVFQLDSGGRLQPDPHPAIAVPGPDDPAFADRGRSGPATLVAAADGRRIYVVDAAGDAVSAIDTVARTVVGAPRPVGFAPWGAALAGDRLLVADEGLMRPRVLTTPAATPAFGMPAPDLARASSLALVPLAAGGALAAPAPGDPAAVPMDPTPDGTNTIGGAHPSAIAVAPDGGYAFVAMTGVDRIATVRLDAAPRVVGGTELRLFDRGPYGTQPTALALSRDGSRLYVALAGLDAVAVIDARDPVHLHRLGLIPTGWDPTALVLSADERSLYVVDAKGFGHDAGSTGGADANAVWSTLQKIDLAATRLAADTLTTLKDTRESTAAVPAYPAAIRNVVVIAMPGTTFDGALGDLGTGPVDPTLAHDPEAVTPNLHALARRYALAGNLFADAEEPVAGGSFLTAGIAGAYTEKTLGFARERRPYAGAGADPEDAPRSGSIFNDLARHRIPFRDYGAGLGVSGYDPSDTPDSRSDGGGRYALDVPAPAVLAGHVDLRYAGANANVTNAARAEEFIRDFTPLVRAGRAPRFTLIDLPSTGTSADDAADADRALGAIVEYLTKVPAWKSTAIFVVPTDPGRVRDHVDLSRTYALVVSPYARRGYIGMRHLSTVSVLKSSEALLHLPPLALGDLLATGMSDFFGGAAQRGGYRALPVAAGGTTGTFGR